MKKLCKRCGNKRKITDFYKDSSNSIGISYRCKFCQNELSKKHHYLNQEKRKKQMLDWQKENIEYVKKQIYKWNKQNRGKRNFLAMKRHAQKLQATPKWLTKEQLKEIEFFYKVAANFQSWTKVKLNVDHIVPLQGKNVSGLHVPWNLQILPTLENIKKSNKFEE